jgi:hypothetical protein
MLNNAFVHAQSVALAKRVVGDVGDERGRQIEQAWLLALGRPPSAGELRLAEAHVAEQERHFREQSAESSPPEAAARPKRDPGFEGLASLCHVLLNSNEFLFVD